MTHGLGVRNISLRREQFRLADDPEFCLGIARSLVAGKIRNQRTMLQRNHVQPPAVAIAQLKCLCDDAENAESSATLLGIEGNAARVYFENFSGMIKAGNARTPNEALAEQLFDWSSASQRPTTPSPGTLPAARRPTQPKREGEAPTEPLITIRFPPPSALRPPSYRATIHRPDRRPPPRARAQLRLHPPQPQAAARSSQCPAFAGL